jgi:putative flippase GtrA
MALSETVLRFTPAVLRPTLLAHREAAKFLVVGGTCFMITTLTNYLLKLTVMSDRPVTALGIGTIIGTTVSYVLNREWSFRTRGGRRRHHEMGLFLLVSAVGIGINVIPLYLSRYALGFETPAVSRSTQEIADFLSGTILGTLLAMVARLWAMKRFVFPNPDARPRLTLDGEPTGSIVPRPATGSADQGSRHPIASPVSVPE